MIYSFPYHLTKWTFSQEDLCLLGPLSAEGLKGSPPAHCELDGNKRSPKHTIKTFLPWN